MTAEPAKTDGPLRLLFTALGYKPAYRLGGPVIVVAELAERLVRKGHQVVVFTSDSNGDEDLDVPVDQPTTVDGVEVWYFRRGRLAKRCDRVLKTVGIMYTPQMAKPLRQYLPTVDAVHTHNPFNYNAYAAARGAARFHQPLFYNQHGAFNPDSLSFRAFRKRLFIDLVARPIMRRATTLIALTQFEVECYQALGVATPCRIVPNGIEVDAYRQQPGPGGAPLWNIPPQAQVVLFMGRLHPTKGVDRLLEAFLQVATLMSDAVLVMAGPDEWGWGGKFRQLVNRAGLTDRVIFPGMVSGETKLDLLARADLFCLPSNGEGFSIAVLEALASGTPVLISPGCHFPEVEKAKVGQVVAPTATALAPALVDLLSQPQRLRTMGALGVEFVRHSYSWDKIVDQLVALYREGVQRYRQLHGQPRQ